MTASRPALTVLRLGRLGDLVMVEPALRWLAADGGADVTLVAGEHYVPAFGRLLPRVRVVPPGAMPRSGLVLDLHRVASSRRLRRSRRWIGVEKEDLLRRARVMLPGLGLRPRLSWPERHLRAAGRALRALGLDAEGPPPPVPRLPAAGAPEPGTLGISPGAGHATKRWPEELWTELARRWPGRVLAFGSRGEAGLVAAVGGEPWPDDSLLGLVDGLSRCEVVVAGDTGPLHLAAALGRRVVGLFGPTPEDCGFWPWGEGATALRLPGLRCAPCSLHGGERCRRRDHACMVGLDVERVLEAARCG